MTGKHQTGPVFPTEADVDAVLDEFEGDTRAAIRALLLDIDNLACGYEANVSRGYVRTGLQRSLMGSA